MIYTVLCIIVYKTQVLRDKKWIKFLENVHYNVLDEVSRDTQRSGHEIELLCNRLYTHFVSVYVGYFYIYIHTHISLASIIPQFVWSSLSTH